MRVLLEGSRGLTPHDRHSIDDWFELRRRSAYDLKGLTPAAAPRGTGSYFPGVDQVSDDNLPDLRRQQSEFHAGEREVDRQNQWMLGPVFAPEMVLAGVDLGGLLSGRWLLNQIGRRSVGAISRAASETGTTAPPRLANVIEDGQSAVNRGQPSVTARTRAVQSDRPVKSVDELQPHPDAAVAPGSGRQALTDGEKHTLRDAARDRYAEAYGKLARDMEAQVHHRIALEFQHLYGKADPNRLSNLIALEQRAHTIATNEWAAFRRSLNGRIPTPAEIYGVARRIDPMIQQYILRPGVARPILPTIPKKPT